MKVVVDARGHRCPTPTLRLRRALANVAAGDVVEIVADDPLARIDIPHFCAENGHTLLDLAIDQTVIRLTVRRGG